MINLAVLSWIKKLNEIGFCYLSVQNRVGILGVDISTDSQEVMPSPKMSGMILKPHFGRNYSLVCFVVRTVVSSLNEQLTEPTNTISLKRFGNG